MARLDQAFGPFGWQVRYTPAQVGSEHGVIASIAIKNPETGEWVEKQDGSGVSDMEPFKGGISGALKRAATACRDRARTLHLPPGDRGGAQVHPLQSAGSAERAAQGRCGG